MGIAGKLFGGEWEIAEVRRERMVHGAESMGGRDGGGQKSPR